MMGNQYPACWVETTIEHILQPQGDGKIIHQGWSPQCEKEPADEEEWGVLKTTAIQDGYYLEDENKKLPIGKDPKPRIEVKANDLLMTNAGPRARCGVVTLVRKTRNKLMISGKMYRLRFDERNIEPPLIEYWLRTSNSQSELNNRKTGISESGLNMTQDRFKTVPVVLPPREEQKQIATKLDELLAQVDTIKTRLDAIPAILKRFRQSVLTAAVSGRLTEEWRGDETYSSDGYPLEWDKKGFSEVGELARGKSKHRPRNDPKLFGDEYPFIQTGEVANSGGEITCANRFYSEFAPCVRIVIASFES